MGPLALRGKLDISDFSDRNPRAPDRPKFLPGTGIFDTADHGDFAGSCLQALVHNNRGHTHHCEERTAEPVLSLLPRNPIPLFVHPPTELHGLDISLFCSGP